MEGRLALDLKNIYHMKKIIFSLLVCSLLSAQAQVLEEYDNEDPSETPKSSIWVDQLFLSVTTSYYIDFITSPVNIYQREYAAVGGGVRYDDAAAQSSYSSFFSIGFEPRLNLYEPKKNLALAVAVPMAIGFGNAFPTENSAGSRGVGHLQVPAMLRLYTGANSTFDAEDDIGVSIGAGFEWNKIGIINLSTEPEPSGINKPWVMPVISLGAHFYRGYTPLEVNLKYGFGKLQNQYLDGFGNALDVGVVTTRANSLKLSLVYLLN